MPDQMDAYDWLCCGHDVSNGRLPSKRLNFPLSPTIDGYFQQLHELEGMILRAKESLRVAPNPRYATLDMKALIDNLNSRWDLLKKQRERDLLPGEEQETDNIEHLRHQSGT